MRMAGGGVVMHKSIKQGWKRKIIPPSNSSADMSCFT